MTSSLFFRRRLIVIERSAIVSGSSPISATAFGQKVEKCTYESDIVVNNDEEVEIGNPKAEENHVREKFQKYLLLRRHLFGS